MPDDPPPAGLPLADVTVIVPLLGNGLAAQAESGREGWHEYLSSIVDRERRFRPQVSIFPLVLHPRAVDRTELGRIFEPYQQLTRLGSSGTSQVNGDSICRDLAQGIAQMAAIPEPRRLTVFVSHTKRAGSGEGPTVATLVDIVRDTIQQTRLAEFFDAHDLQVGTDWSTVLRERAAEGALLAVRTDLYASREWCQREMVIAKLAGMPIVTLDALGQSEERGSFLMDHTPRVPVRPVEVVWSDQDVLRGLNLLVDEALKRVLWKRQERLGRGRMDLQIAWWAPHAPEAITLVAWLGEAKSARRLPENGPIRILHPDPPLGPEELAALERISELAGLSGRLDILTPRMLAARGG
jgi:hypothetical protein